MRTPFLSNNCCRVAFTNASETCTRTAISLLESPSATPLNTACSRLVRAFGGGGEPGSEGHHCRRGRRSAICPQLHSRQEAHALRGLDRPSAGRYRLDVKSTDADGPLTSRLQQIREGDTILVGRKATGTLIADNLIPGQRLLLLSTGTGLAPFASLIKDPEVYDRFETIVLVHGCRQVSELAYGEELVAKLRDDEFLGPLLTEKDYLHSIEQRYP